MTVHMIGAGPGDPELITLKAINALKYYLIFLKKREKNDVFFVLCGIMFM